MGDFELELAFLQRTINGRLAQTPVTSKCRRTSSAHGGDVVSMGVQTMPVVSAEGIVIGSLEIFSCMWSIKAEAPIS